jgi:hypothetical protein
MIYEINKSLNNEVVLIPQYPNWNAWEAYDMLSAAFPPNYQKYNPIIDFGICCFNGYENGISFANYK